MIEVAYLQFLPSTRTGEKLLTHTLLIVVMLGLFYTISLSISMAILHYVFSDILFTLYMGLLLLVCIGHVIIAKQPDRVLL